MLLMLLRLHHLQISKPLLHLHFRKCNRRTSQQNHSTKCNKQTTTTTATTNSIVQRLWALLLARYKNSLAATNRHFSASASDHQRSLQRKKNHNNNNNKRERIPFPTAILSHNSCNNALHPLYIYKRMALTILKLGFESCIQLQSSFYATTVLL
jgi:hypothetical protein